MAKFIKAETKVVNFENALKFMEERMNYYENELNEPSDWEVLVLGTDDDTHMWIKMIGENFFDTMIEEEQTGGCRITQPMDLEELKMLLGEDTDKKRIQYTYQCGEIYMGK